jgi:protein-S-isoprenylcysteine O-methyltransferase Ste14
MGLSSVTRRMAAKALIYSFVTSVIAYLVIAKVFLPDMTAQQALPIMAVVFFIAALFSGLIAAWMVGEEKEGE